MASLDTDSAAVTLLVIDYGYMVALEYPDAKINRIPQSIAVRIITLAETANIRRTK